MRLFLVSQHLLVLLSVLSLTRAQTTAGVTTTAEPTTTLAETTTETTTVLTETTLLITSVSPETTTTPEPTSTVAETTTLLTTTATTAITTPLPTTTAAETTTRAETSTAGITTRPDPTTLSGNYSQMTQLPVSVGHVQKLPSSTTATTTPRTAIIGVQVKFTSFLDLTQSGNMEVVLQQINQTLISRGVSSYFELKLRKVKKTSQL